MTKKITLTIQGMECPNCAISLERMEDELPGVLLAEASYRKATLVVEFDEARVTEAQIRAEVVKKGYQPAD